MKIIGEFTVTDVYPPCVDHANGHHSNCKELILSVTYDTEDDAGVFQGVRQIVIPVPYDTPIGDHPELVGCKIKMNLEFPDGTTIAGEHCPNKEDSH